MNLKNVEAIWKSLPISHKDKNNEGFSKIDAYIIDNEEVKSYIEEREVKYKFDKILSRDMRKKLFHGGEDDETIIYRKRKKRRMALYCHLDPITIRYKGED